MRRIVTTAALLLALAGTTVPASAAGALDMDLRIVDQDVPLEGVQVTIFLSCDKVAGVTDADGNVHFESDCNGRQFWVEVDGERIAELYRTDRAPESIDLSTVTYMDWEGGR